MSGSPERPVIRAISYNGLELDEVLLVHPREAIALVTDRPDRVTWIHVHGMSSEPMLRELGMIFDVHPLALEDVVQMGQRPSTTEYEAHRMVTARSMQREADGRLASQQVSMFLGEHFILTFAESAKDLFDPMRDRLRRKRGMLRKLGPDYLLYTLLDAVVDQFFPLMEALGDEMEALDAEMLRTPSQQTLRRVHVLRGDLLAVRRVIWPMREVISALLRDDSGLINPDTRLHLRDCYDHAAQLVEMVETGREMSSSLMDVYTSTLSHRTNEVMKVLTVVTTVFVPLTFIAGVYGMNFDPNHSPFNMPELRWHYGYPIVLGIMLVTAVVMLWLVRRIAWLSHNGTAAPPVEGPRPVPVPAPVPLGTARLDPAVHG